MFYENFFNIGSRLILAFGFVITFDLGQSVHIKQLLKQQIELTVMEMSGFLFEDKFRFQP